MGSNICSIQDLVDAITFSSVLCLLIEFLFSRIIFSKSHYFHTTWRTLGASLFYILQAGMFSRREFFLFLLKKDKA